jgi:hypothetical protein
MKETANNYLPADEYFIINQGDCDLTPVYISLPSPPPLHLIDGYDLPRDEQYFRRLVIPKRLEIIEKEVYERLRNEYNRNNNNSITVEKTIDLFWFLFEDRREDLKKEEEFIKKVHWYRTYGYWFFNDGKPTWIPPDYFDFLNFWTLQDGEKPEYRDKDRRKYCFWHYLKHATETFADLDKEGRAMKVDGKYTMIEVGARVFFGCAEPKTRRSGATQQGCHGIKKGIEDMFGGFGTIVSMDGDNAVVHFSKKLLNGLKEYPLFLKAKWDGNNTSNSIKYRARQNDPGNPSLNGSITYTESAGESKNDGDELHYFLSDEEGKCAVVQVDILERWNVNKKAQSKGLGSTIMGFCWHPSTVETMNAGGISYRKLIDMSNFYQRIEGKGQTFSGLAMCFFSATDGAENFIDRFGMSVINKPTERQIALRPDALFARMKMGSHDYMMKERNRLLSDGSPAALELYRSMRRKEPMSFAECWIGTAGDMVFNLEKIDQRMIELNRRSKIRKGNLKWKGGIPDSEVIFVDDENGRWEFSFLPDESARNLKTKVRVYNSRTAKYEWQWKGLNWNIFTIGVDPFGYTNKAESKLRDDNSRQSNGGLACLRSRDLETDKSDDPNTWKTRRFICSYSHRPPSTYDFNEDVLMTAVFTGGSVYLERNRENTWQHLIERGYGGFLQYDLDMSTGRPKDKPGAYASETNKDELFSEIKDYIEYHCHIEEHASFLTEVKNIRGKEEMTKFDRFTAHGWALIGDKRKTGGLYRKKEEPKGRMPSMTSIVNALLR